MSSIITSILSSTVGLLWNGARDLTAAKLKDGDVTDTKIREIFVSESNDIKTKLDGLSRKDLLSSYDFLQEGVHLLNVSLDKSKLEQKAETTAGRSSVIQSEILREAVELSQAIRELKINADKEFESALERFKDARKAATHAFRIESLHIEERIVAAKLRVVSELLECLESPETAIPGCLSLLKKLHALPAVQGMFNVYLNGGIKSMWNKDQRAENVKSVMMINYVVFKYVFKFSRKYTSVHAWSTIELADRSFNPILKWREVSTRESMGDELTQPPNKLILNTINIIRPHRSAVNSHGNVFVNSHGDDSGSIMLINKKGKSKVVNLPSHGGNVVAQFIDALAVDNDDNVYVVRYLRTRTENDDVDSYVLDVLDENYNVKQDSRRLEFLKATYYVEIAINKNNDIIMTTYDDPQVGLYICDKTGKLKHKFERRHYRQYYRSLGISGQDEIMISSEKNRAVEIYSVEGNLKSTIKLPEGHEVRGLVFHYVICKIIILTMSVERKYFLLCYTEAGELHETTAFVIDKEDYDAFGSPSIKSHPSGPVAVVEKRSITFI
ncbi:Hypothetical predicted protein [Paramuricea clavata]|uniref:Uncharacterized protein n=1 Tax=Paramuricea clavata TaxID=317549 RepID=A0A6S7KFM6_PARCT|nr:Hypothetical predicted protein [Paramuricea clavata]